MRLEKSGQMRHFFSDATEGGIANWNRPAILTLILNLEVSP